MMPKFIQIQRLCRSGIHVHTEQTFVSLTQQWYPLDLRRSVHRPERLVCDVHPQELVAANHLHHVVDGKSG